MVLGYLSFHNIPPLRIQQGIAAPAWRHVQDRTPHGYTDPQAHGEIDGEASLGGSGKVVEVDETNVGGKSIGMDWRKVKTVVMGMAERGGDVMFKVVDDATRASLMPQITENIIEGSEIRSDELRSYKGAQMAPYTHTAVNHSKGEYAKPDGTTTNSIENFFGHLKRSIAGTHISFPQRI